MVKLDAKILKWAKAEGKEQFIKKSPNLLKALYAEANKASRISELMDGMECEMNVMVVKITSRDVRVCNDCNAKVCKDSCGEESYTTKEANTVTVGDEFDAQIALNFPPWYEGDITELNHIYKISGVAKGRKVGDDLVLEVSNVKVLEELEEDDFKPKGNIEAEGEEDSEGEGEDEEEEKPAKKEKADPKTEKLFNKVRNLFRANDGVRTSKQLKVYLSGIGAEDKYSSIVKGLGLSKNEDGELEYVDEEE